MSGVSRVVMFAAVVAAAGCADDSKVDVLTYEEFEAQAYRDPVTGAYVLNGDEPVLDEAQLREVYAAYLDSVTRASTPGYGTTTQGLILNVANGAYDRWSPASAMDLRYCVSTTSFGLRYAQVVLAMQNAAKAWENVARVKFIHDVTKDVLCNDSTEGVVFNVRQVTGTNYLALAFFPSSSRAYRVLQIDTAIYGNIAPITLTGVLRHELGHILGFRHEHTRPEAGTCFENNSWYPVTPYDSKSVMHYPHCNGTQTGDLNLTAYDIGGAAAVYPPQ
jgi:hypothetical protein